MSRALRRQLFSIWDSLQEAHLVIKELLDKRQEDAVVGLLADCQDGAIAIGNKLEAVYGTDLKTIHALESYCENVYHVAENIQSAERCDRAYVTASQQLAEVRTIMEQELPDKLEVVFLPYKASMWDSLESIYLAAVEDEDSEVYCVPIPYYERKSDKSFELGELHDEKDLYPANIPVVDWQTYNLEERLPDIVFIHNPYDDWNLITSVHPRFYAKNLKKYTEKLVYVPYFVLDEVGSIDDNIVKGMENFCFVPGVIYADKVIVQSENMRQTYIEVYSRVAEKEGIQVDRKQLEEKILGIGSPKIEKIQNACREDVEIPTEWLKLMKTSTGEWKKIILYNTSLNALWPNNEKYFEKIRDVFVFFKQHQEDTVLLWRPHPLMESSIQSMRPWLLDEYRELVDGYKREGWGIYDDTTDLDRAIALCDAYYGDHSSLVGLCQAAGKPVMIQEVTIRNSEKE